LAVASLGAQAGTAELEQYLTIGTREVVLETATNKGIFSSTMQEDVSARRQRSRRAGDNVFFDLPGVSPDGGISGAVATAGQVIQVGRDLVALGEEIYTLVKKGEPVISTEYAPISVVPRISAEAAVDVLADTENWSMPKSQKVTVVYKNLYGAEVVRFEYNLIFSHSGTYNGTGAYITAAQIVPAQVSCAFGYEFESSMRLSGVQNHGSTASPVAGAILNVQYKAKSILSAQQTNDTYHITGRGQIRKL